MGGLSGLVSPSSNFRFLSGTLLTCLATYLPVYTLSQRHYESQHAICIPGDIPWHGKGSEAVTLEGVP